MLVFAEDEAERRCCKVFGRQRKFGAMAEEAASAVGAGADVNTAGNPTDIAMAYLQDGVTFGFLNVNQLFESCVRSYVA